MVTIPGTPRAVSDLLLEVGLQLLQKHVARAAPKPFPQQQPLPPRKTRGDPARPDATPQGRVCGDTAAPVGHPHGDPVSEGPPQVPSAHLRASQHVGLCYLDALCVTLGVTCRFAAAWRWGAAQRGWGTACRSAGEKVQPQLCQCRLPEPLLARSAALSSRSSRPAGEEVRAVDQAAVTWPRSTTPTRSVTGGVYPSARAG